MVVGSCGASGTGLDGEGRRSLRCTGPAERRAHLDQRVEVVLGLATESRGADDADQNLEILELAAAIGTTNTLFPATQNPWREGITPGGSSGGSAAAVAAGMTTVALGGDTGGSIRIPASCCGLVGLRPTPDRVPNEEVDVTVMQSRGPMARSVASMCAW